MKNAIHKKKRATVIIGAGFGDEGKGLLTDWAAARAENALVVRFNGGAQAGHTVVSPDGTRHVHSHFGSGTLTNAPTFLSRFFVSNPLIFAREALELAAKITKIPTVFADRAGLVTTPYDMLLNQFAEQERGAGRHGSCGVGFGETIERSLNEEFSIVVGDLGDRRKLSRKLESICARWLPARLEKLGLANLSDERCALLFASDLKNNFLDSCEAFFDSVEIAPRDILRRKNASEIVFEGAQGLLLDQEIGWFPHVTRSFTGLKNVVELAAEAEINDLEVIYATRCYATRHGAGPLPHEQTAPPFEKIRDETNVHNPYQENLRFALLDLDLLGRTIEADFSQNRARKINLERSLAITCLDQLGDQTPVFIESEKRCAAKVDEFVQRAARAAAADKIYLSRGATRATVTKIETIEKSCAAASPGTI